MSVTVSDVKKVYPTDSDLSGFLATAQLLVSNQLSDKGLSNDTLDQITIYLTAHFATIGLDKGGLKSKKVGESSESYKVTGDKDTGLKSSGYGQMAMLLDSSGTLAGLNSQSTSLPALFEVVSPSIPVSSS